MWNTYPVYSSGAFRTPGTNLDTGGSDWEGEAQSPGEPTLPTLGLWDFGGNLACPASPAGATSDIASSSVEVAVPNSGGKNLLLPNEKSSKKGPLVPKIMWSHQIVVKYFGNTTHSFG